MKALVTWKSEKVLAWQGTARVLWISPALKIMPCGMQNGNNNWMEGFYLFPLSKAVIHAVGTRLVRHSSHKYSHGEEFK